MCIFSVLSFWLMNAVYKGKLDDSIVLLAAQRIDEFGFAVNGSQAAHREEREAEPNAVTRIFSLFSFDISI